MKSVIRGFQAVLCITGFSVACAWLFVVVRCLIGSTSGIDGLLNDFILAFTVTGALLTTIVISFILISRIIEARLNTDAFANGYSDKHFIRLEKRVKRARSVSSKNKALIQLAGCYAQAKRYDDAFSALDKTSIDAMDERQRLDYFNTSLYTAIMSDDLQTAEQIYISAKALFDKYSSPAIEHTIASLEYLRGNLYSCETMLMSIKEHTRNKCVNAECNILLIMIYLKTERADDAKVLAELTVPMVYDYQSRQQLIRLMRCIENAYGIYDSDDDAQIENASDDLPLDQTDDIILREESE